MADAPPVKKRLLRFFMAFALSPLMIGCGGVIGEIAVAVVIIKMIAVGAFTILSVAGAYWFVESARLDTARKELILQGMKDGKQANSTVQLTDEQLKTIEETGKLKIQFEDGREVEVDVDQ